jgi:hypothetical protein
MDTLKNHLFAIKSLLSSKRKKDLRHEERISKSSRSMEKGTIGYALLGKKLLYHLKACESFKGEFTWEITACHFLSFTKHSHD